MVSLEGQWRRGALRKWVLGRHDLGAVVVFKNSIDGAS